MLYRVQSAAVFGIKAYPISVEVDLSTGQKLNMMTVGLPDTAVRESSERVKAALRNCGHYLPAQHITASWREHILPEMQGSRDKADRFPDHGMEDGQGQQVR